MTNRPLSVQGSVPSWQRWLDKPQTNLICLAGWVFSSALFIGAVALFGGPAQGDAAETLYATWAVAHGNIGCAYPPMPHGVPAYFYYYLPVPSAPPLWPLVSGALAALTSIGHTAAFPSTQAMGANCAHAYDGMYRWAQNSVAIFPTIGLGYISWFFLLAGMVALLRASGRGRTGWEPFTVIFVALVPIVWEPVLLIFHPQDLACLGLALAGSACALRGRWVWAGIFIGTAVTSQQFALLVLVPLFVIAPGKQRWRFLISAAGAAAIITAPFIVASSGRAIRSVVLGTGDSTTFGGTVLWESGLRGLGLTFFARVLPLALSGGIAWWAHRRATTALTEPVPFVSLLATCLSLRLVFEEGLFGYKFMALAVMLILLAVVCGHVRGRLVAWLVLTSLAFNPIPRLHAVNARPWGEDVAALLALICIAVVVILIVVGALRRRIPWYLVAWLVVAACAFIQWPPWSLGSLRSQLPLWFWQLVLVPAGVAMAVTPLLRSVRLAGVRPTSPLAESAIDHEPLTTE